MIADPPSTDLPESALATGGALASGKAGIFDFNSTATASTRNYDNFLVTVPTPDPHALDLLAAGADRVAHWEARLDAVRAVRS